MSDTEKQVSAKKKHRSPSYPALGLKDAIGKAEVIYKQEKRHSVPVAVVAGHFGFDDMKSSSALRLIAALKHYGLVVEEGSGDARKVRLSDLALDIVLSESEDSPKRIAAIRKAALLPNVCSKIWTHFQGNLPSSATLSNYLIRDLDFNDDVVDLFIKKFRGSVAFAGLTPSDSIEDDGDEDETGEDAEQEMDEDKSSPDNKGKDAGKGVRTGGGGRNDNWGGPVVKFDLPRGNAVEIRLRSKLTPTEFKSLKKIFDLSELAFVDNSSDQDNGNVGDSES